MPFPTTGEAPGMSAVVTTVEKAVIWGNNYSHHDINNLLVGSTAVDAGSTPTTDLRPGLLLGKTTSDSKLRQWNAEAVDGTELVAGVLYRPLPMLDGSGVAADKSGFILLRDLPLITADLLIKGTALASHADEHIARRQLAALGFRLNDDPRTPAVFPLVDLTVSGTTLTPTTAQNYYRFILTNAAAVAVTLPTLEPGLMFEFLRYGDEELAVSSAAGDDIIGGNDLSQDSVTWTTAGQHIGARVKFESIRTGTTLKWLPTIQVTVFGTTNAGLAFSIGT